MLSQGGDTDLLEQVLTLVLEDQDDGENSADNIVGVALIDWLKLLSECSQFGMMIQLSSSELLTKVSAKIDSSGIEDVEALRELYQRKRKV